MRLTIDHTTTYTLDPPRSRVIQSLRMTPASHAAQQVLRWDITSENASFGAAFRDGAGNHITTMTVPGPVSELVILVTGEVETTDTAGVLRGLKEAAEPAVYLRKTRMTAPGVALQALVDDLDGASPRELGTMHKMAALVSETVQYTPGATQSGMTASEVLELGQGVCQDQAQVLIALARMIGIPARYVTGYLYADASGTSHEASHAWAELHVPDLGWVGFDPANECCPDERYVRIASGMDALDAAPIRGISLGGGAETMDIQVSVAAQQ